MNTFNHRPDYPLVCEIDYVAPQQLFARFAAEPYAVLLESAHYSPHTGRYSFIAVAPFAILNSKNGWVSYPNYNGSGNPFTILAQQLAKYSLRTWPGLPPFQGGMVGYLAYELNQHLEKILVSAADDMVFPDMRLACYDLVIGFDHSLPRAWLFSSGFPETERTARQQRAQARSQWLLQQLQITAPVMPFSNGVCSAQEISANFTAQTYCVAVQQAIQLIEAGDIFQVNLAQRFRAPLPPSLTPFALYQRLQNLNPAPFAAYLNLAEVILISASPERFLRVNQGKVETRPIKGTRPRGPSPEKDEQRAQQLITNEKERAENIMIVDLLRNDLSRVCQPASVKVTQLCGLESYAAVHHLVSAIEGQLRENCDVGSLLQATWPGGSISGAPKVRAMEIIAALEPVRRGPYCGCLGYWGYDGAMDCAITIRSLAIKNNQVVYHAGSGITAASDPLAEYEEVLLKAQALQRSLTKA